MYIPTPFFFFVLTLLKPEMVPLEYPSISRLQQYGTAYTCEYEPDNGEKGVEVN